MIYVFEKELYDSIIFTCFYREYLFMISDRSSFLKLVKSS